MQVVLHGRRCDVREKIGVRRMKAAVAVTRCMVQDGSRGRTKRKYACAASLRPSVTTRRIITGVRHETACQHERNEGGAGSAGMQCAQYESKEENTERQQQNNAESAGSAEDVVSAFARAGQTKRTIVKQGNVMRLRCVALMVSRRQARYGANGNIYNVPQMARLRRRR